jgi:hypothetical protein
MYMKVILIAFYKNRPTNIFHLELVEKNSSADFSYDIIIYIFNGLINYSTAAVTSR